MKRTILLSDIDGTLVDSNCLHADAWRRAFEHFGIDVGLDEAWRQIGKGGDNLVPAFVKEQDRDGLVERLTQYRKDLFHREYMNRLVSFPKSRELLVRVREKHMRIGLATSANEEELDFYGALVMMKDLIQKASTKSDVRRSKPDPDVFASALAKLGASSEEAIALGDTPYDAEAATKLGIPIVGLTCGGWKRRDPLGAGCIEVYAAPADLLENFNRSALADGPC